MLTYTSQASRIDRDDHSNNGHHCRRRSSLKRYLARADPPNIIYNRKKKMPYKYRNTDQPRNFSSSESLYEHPSRPYPYSRQNTNGRIHVVGADGIERIVEPELGHTRTIMNRHKTIKGVCYHRHGEPQRLTRAQEIYPPSSSSSSSPPSRGPRAGFSI